MTNYFLNTAIIAVSIISNQQPAQTSRVHGKHTSTSQNKTIKNLYMDIHHFGPGKVSYEDVAQAHEKDLAVQKKHGVKFINYWVNEKDGNVYCLSVAKNSRSVVDTHAEAHGLLPDEIFLVKGTMPGAITANRLFMDIHRLGARKVKIDDVKKAHQKDLATQARFGVSFLNYWVNEKTGTIFCLSQAPDSSAVINTHKAAHGLIPASIEEVEQGGKVPTAYLNNNPLYYIAHFLIVCGGRPLYQSAANLLIN